MAWETSQPELFIFLKPVSKKYITRAVDFITRSRCHRLAWHHDCKTNPDLCCEILHLSCFIYVPDDVCPSRTDLWFIDTAQIRNHITGLVLNLHNLIHGVAFMRRASCGSFPPDQSTALHSAQARWQWNCQKLQTWRCTTLVRHFYAVWSAHVTTVLTDFKDKRVDELNSCRPQVAGTVSEWGYPVKMSRVFDRKRGQQWRKGDDRGDKLTSCCWSVCPVRRSCNFPAVCWSGVTGPHRSHLCSPRQSFHQTDPGPRLRYCASAGHKRRIRLNQGQKN